MSRCLWLPRARYGPRFGQFRWRWLSTQAPVEHVRVPCASSGYITVSLHNTSKHDAATPLVIFIPPFPQTSHEQSTPLPLFVGDYPTAVINYRWQPLGKGGLPETPLHWPAPLHDVHFGYSWITANLGSGSDSSAGPRPAYVYGSYLGASLAASLALTESHVPARSLPMTVRGLVAHNGVYNWTMFLPDHPNHKLKSKFKARGRNRGVAIPPISIDGLPAPAEEEGMLTELKRQAPGLFSEPGNLFDPFASACLFFHSANLHVPDDFTTPLSASPPLSAEFTAAVDALAGSSAAADAAHQTQDDEPAEILLARAAVLAKQSKPPRKGYLVFPPRQSALRLPSSLFLYDRPRGHSRSASPSASAMAEQKLRRRGALNTGRNSFYVQAMELAALMSRSLDMFELKRRPVAPWEGDKWQDEEEASMSEIERRVQTCEVEPSVEGKELELDGRAEERVAEWLRERVDEDFGGE